MSINAQKYTLLCFLLLRIRLLYHLAAGPCAANTAAVAQLVEKVESQSKKIVSSIPGLDEGPFFVEFACLHMFPPPYENVFIWLNKEIPGSYHMKRLWTRHCPGDLQCAAFPEGFNKVV